MNFEETSELGPTKLEMEYTPTGELDTAWYRILNEETGSVIEFGYEITDRQATLTSVSYEGNSAVPLSVFQAVPIAEETVRSANGIDTVRPFLEMISDYVEDSS